MPAPLEVPQVREGEEEFVTSAKLILLFNNKNIVGLIECVIIV